MPKRKLPKTKEDQSTIDGKGLFKVKKLATELLNEDTNEEVKLKSKINIGKIELDKNDSDSEENSENMDSDESIDDEFEIDEDAKVFQEALLLLKSKKIDNQNYKLVKETKLENIVENKSYKDILPEELVKDLSFYMANMRKTDKIPSIIKLLPSKVLNHELLSLFDFPKWSIYSVSRITVYYRAKGNKSCIKFMNTFFLPYIQNYIREHGNLHNDLYASLASLTWRQEEFIKGIVLPWCKNINAKEAELLTSIIKTKTVSSKLASQCLIVLMQMEPTLKSILIIIRCYIDKEIAFSVDILPVAIKYFSNCAFGLNSYSVCMFVDNKGKCPIELWHKTLYKFVQNTYNNFSKDSISQLKDLCDKVQHLKWTPLTSEFLIMQENNLKKSV